jgi:peptidoglycan/LPS O-acetylase OafA/YrhL
METPTKRWHLRVFGYVLMALVVSCFAAVGYTEWLEQRRATVTVALMGALALALLIDNRRELRQLEAL